MIDREKVKDAFSNCVALCHDIMDMLIETPTIVPNNTMPTIGGWISVKDRLPEDEGEYIVFEKDGYMDISDYFEGEFSVLSEVTHWMPLPEPPKEET